MGLFIKKFEETIPENKHYILVLDNAKWHGTPDIYGKKITLRFLPPYSPELNPIERLWLYIKDRFLSLTYFKDDQDLLEKGQKAWRALSKKEIISVCKNSNNLGYF
jgi:transposase